MPLLGEPIQGFPPSPSVGAAVNAMVLASTALTVVVAHVPAVGGGYVLKLDFAVSVAATTVAFVLSWTDPIAGAQNQTLISAVLDPGAYNLPSYPFSGAPGQEITLGAQAGTANQVTVTASIEKQV